VTDRRDVGRLQAGLLAASSIVAAKQIAVRNALPATPPRIHPSSLGDIPRLFGRQEQIGTDRVTRVSAAALLYSANKDITQAEKILRERERKILSKLDSDFKKRKDTDRSCPHCRLLNGALYEDTTVWGTLPPIAVVNHNARIDVEFDPETNISHAQIESFQVVVPHKVAEEAIRLAHPLRWAETPGGLFERAYPSDATGVSLGKGANVEQQWEMMAAKKSGAFVYEDVVWPLNEDLRARSENVIRILNLQRNGDSSLSYDYDLQCSVRSNFGVAWESAGLDLDGGTFNAHAVALNRLKEKPVVDRAFPKGAMRRNVYAIKAIYDAKAGNDLSRGWKVDEQNPIYVPEEVEPAEMVEALLTLNLKLERRWRDLKPFHLLTVTASKELHFTIPENGPIELWQTLTFTAPAVLFMFLNQAVCLAPHVLLNRLVNPLSDPTGVVFAIGGRPDD
jgi:hypothetical protein